MLDKKTIILINVSALITLIFGVFVISYSDGDGFLIGLGVVLIVWSVLLFLLDIYYIPQYIKEEQIQKENLLRIQREQQEKERIKKEFEELCASGNWTFEAKDFYNICKENKISDLNNEFYFEKAKLLFENLMKKNNVLKKHWELYNSKEQILKYYDEGKKQIEFEKIDREKRKTQAFNTPINVDLNEAEKTEKTFYDSLQTTYGIEKCRKMLDRIIKQQQEKITELKNASKAASELSNITMNSVYTQKENDWATLGGIASGLAGPAAGLAVAQQAILENEKIEAQNQKNREYAANLATNFVNAEIAAETKIRYENNIIKQYKQAYANLENIMVLKSVSSEEIFEKLNVSANISEKKIQLNITNNFVPDVPNGVRIVVDGTIKVKVKFKTSDSNEFVYLDEVVVPLCLNGIKCSGGKGSCYNYIQKTVLGKNRNYKFEIEPNSLWLMEEVEI